MIGPDGQWIAGPVFGQECIVYADLDLEQVAREQFALDTVGHYSRPDIFELTVDTRRRPQVTWIEDREAQEPTQKCGPALQGRREARAQGDDR